MATFNNFLLYMHVIQVIVVTYYSYCKFYIEFLVLTDLLSLHLQIWWSENNSNRSWSQVTRVHRHWLDWSEALLGRLWAEEDWSVKPGRYDETSSVLEEFCTALFDCHRSGVFVSVCVCVRERERERESMFISRWLTGSMHTYTYTHTLTHMIIVSWYYIIM